MQMDYRRKYCRECIKRQEKFGLSCRDGFSPDARILFFEARRGYKIVLMASIAFCKRSWSFPLTVAQGTV